MQIGQEHHIVLEEMFRDLSDFIFTDPRLPDGNKNFIRTIVPEISVEDDREKIVHKIIKYSSKSESALLTLYVYRDMERIDWIPFIKAAVERNPVCLQDLEGKTIDEVYTILSGMPDHSIYDGNRLAQPDEVWNFRRGDGIEKALLMADFILSTEPDSRITIEADHKKIRLFSDSFDYSFESNKSFRKKIQISKTGYIVN